MEESEKVENTIESVEEEIISLPVFIKCPGCKTNYKSDKLIFVLNVVNPKSKTGDRYKLVACPRCGISFVIDRRYTIRGF